MMSQDPRWPALLTKEEACRYLHIGESTLRALRSQRLIRSVRVTNSSLIRYRRSDLDNFVNNLEESEGESPRKDA